MDNWLSNATVVEYQPGGPGNAILLLPASATVTGPSGGGRSVESRFVRNFRKGAGAYKVAGVAVSGDPERITADLSMRLDASAFLRKRKFLDCEHTLIVREHCGNVEDVTNYNKALVLSQTRATGYAISENVANGTTQVAPDVMDTINESASELTPRRKLTHLDISGSVSDFAINDIISVGVEQCAGNCGLENDGNQDFWAVTDADSTPGYQSIAAPVFLYTTDGGTTWTAKYIDVGLSANALRVYRIGGYVFAALGASGVAYAKYDDIVAGVSNPFTLATGLSGLTINALSYAGGNEVYAVGNSGQIAKSTDGGFSFTVISAGTITAQNLNDVVFESQTLGWIVGNAGVVIKYFNGALSLITISGLSSNINTVALPEDRSREVYIGTAGGTIYRSRDVGVTWSSMAFPGSGTGSVKKLAFSGVLGQYLWILQHNVAGNKSRLMRDITGGALGAGVEIIGSFDSPANSLINSCAPSEENVCLTAGELDGSYAFLGKAS